MPCIPLKSSALCASLLALLAATPWGTAHAAQAPAEQAISAPGPLAPLRGTLSLAGPNAPVVLMLPGSGPTDRDGNNALGVNAAPYRLLAEGLATQGISTVRIDKRGLFASAGAVTNPNAVTLADYVQDTTAWAQSIRQRTGAHCVWLLGHSEGGLVALASAAENPAWVCGVVLVSAPGFPLSDVLKKQLSTTPFSAQADEAIDALKAGKTVDTTPLPPVLQRLFRPGIQGFLRSLFAVTPTVLVQRIHAPVLIVQGTRDLQVSVQNAQALKAAAPQAVLTLLPNTNHVLKSVLSDDRKANLATYADPALPLAPGVLENIAPFVKQPLPAHAF